MPTAIAQRKNELYKLPPQQSQREKPSLGINKARIRFAPHIFAKHGALGVEFGKRYEIQAVLLQIGAALGFVPSEPPHQRTIKVLRKIEDVNKRNTESEAGPAGNIGFLLPYQAHIYIPKSNL